MKEMVQMSKREQLQQKLKELFYTYNDVVGTSIRGSIEVSATYSVVATITDRLVFVALTNTKSGYKVHALTIETFTDDDEDYYSDDVLFEGYFYDGKAEYASRVSEFRAFTYAKGSKEFDENFKYLVNTVPTDFQVECFLRGLTNLI